MLVLISLMASGFCAAVDHLVNNAGISQAEYFEDCTEVSDLTHIMV